MILLVLGLLGFGACFDWLQRILPSAQVVWAGWWWWVTAAQWDNETEDLPLPSRYLPVEASAVEE